MQLKSNLMVALGATSLMTLSCSNDKQVKSENKQVTEANQQTTPISSTATEGLQPPAFSDPELNKYYTGYTAYMNKVVTAIRNKDEEVTMALFNSEGKNYFNMYEMEKKAKIADEQKFNDWLMTAYPYQKEIVQSAYYKKFNEEYYKNVKEKADKKGN